MSGRKILEEILSKAVAAHRAGRLADAAQLYADILKRDPTQTDVLLNYGDILLAQNRVHDAIDAYRQVTTSRPSHARARYNLGVALRAAGKLEAAADAFRTAAALDAKLYQAHANLGVILHDAGRWDEAEASYSKALALKPDDAESLNNLAILHRDRGSFQSAQALFERSLTVSPHIAETHRNLALLMLLQHDYARGWTEYEWRWRCQNMLPLVRPFMLPRWGFEDLRPEDGLLVWSEQGLGDEILFASMLRDVASLGFRVGWEADHRLLPLLARSESRVTYFPRTTPPDRAINEAGFVVQSPAGSLGARFRQNSKNFPLAPAFLIADPAKVGAIRQRLNQQPNQRVVGVSWRSRNADIGQFKTIRLGKWAQLLADPRIRPVNLQYGDTAAEVAEYKSSGGEIETVEGIDLTDDIDGLAALIVACDLVITVSNTTAHLAAALGVPVWVLVPPAAGKLWYWGHSLSTTPWYPAARVFRIPSGSPGTDALVGVQESLTSWLAAGSI